MMKHEAGAFGRAVYHAGQKDGAANIMRLMDTIQKTAQRISRSSRRASWASAQQAKRPRKPTALYAIAWQSIGT